VPIMRRRGSLLVPFVSAAWAVFAAVASASWGFASFAGARRTVTTTTQTGSPVTKVDVRNDNGDIAFRPGSRGTIARAEAWNFVRPSNTQSLRSGTLPIRARCPKMVRPTSAPSDWLPPSDWLRQTGSVRLVITVPPNHRASHCPYQ